MNKINPHKELKVFQLSFNAAMEIFKMTKDFPKEETYSMTDQIRRSSRSVSANLAESFRKRRYPKHFISKLTDCEAEAAETQVWLDFAEASGYISKETHDNLFDKYDHIISMLVLMESKPENWSW
jgi:four helix bundle protein